MPKVLCTLENASDEISGVKFTSHPDGGKVSDEISAEAAEVFTSIPGYELVEEGEPAKPAAAPAPAPKAPAAAKPAAAPKKAAKEPAAPAPAPVEQPAAEAPAADASAPDADAPAADASAAGGDKGQDDDSVF